MVGEKNLGGGVFMYVEFPYILFADPQAVVPAGFCEACGCELYAPGLHCLRCERRERDDIDGAEQGI